LYVLILLVPSVAVAWLGLDAIARDRASSAAARDTDRARIATQVEAGIAQAVSSTARQLKAAPDVLRQAVDASSLVVDWPRGLSEAPAGYFDAAERAEHRDRDLQQASSLYRSLVDHVDPRIRAGAWLRLAGVQVKLGDREAALESYGRLASLASAAVAGLPADFVALRARVELLAGPPRHRLADREAKAMSDSLLGGRWPMDDATWRFYVRKASGWLPGDAPAPTDRFIERRGRIVEWLWNQISGEHRSGVFTQTTLMPLDEQTFVVLSDHGLDRFVALVASPEFQQRAWVMPAVTAAADDRVRVSITDSRVGPPSGDQSTDDVRSTFKRLDGALAAWTVVVADRDPELVDASAAARRRALRAGLGLMIALVFAGGYVVARAVSRELAVARMQSDFVSAVSHEFRTPLTSMRQLTDLLREPNEPPPGKRRMFYAAQARAVERLQRLVESLLDFGRMEAGARPYSLAPVSAVELVRDVATDFRRDALPDGFTLETEMPADDLMVNGDRSALVLAIWNLLDNAVKYCGGGRSITLSAARTSDGVAISVRDAGLGISPTEQPRVFDKFVRGTASQTSGAPGTGIGLAIVRHIADGHRGHVRLRSAPGEGSTFTITLPEAEHS
jgi:signal transduction histidine kinase